MKLYKRVAANGVEHIVQAANDKVATAMGLVPYEPPATKAKTAANKQRKAETKEA